MATEEKTRRTKIEVKKSSFTIFYTAGEDPELVPWVNGEKGNHTFLKLTWEEATEEGVEEKTTAFLFMGNTPARDAELQKTVMKLVNEGWKVEGEVNIYFESQPEQVKEELFDTDLIRIELGLSLLPLVDPSQGSPLTETVGELRKEIAKETGFVTPGIRICDNLKIQSNDYAIYIKDTPIAFGELFLDRFLAMGSMEQLSNLKGWMTHDPVYNSPAKWIEKDEREKAENDGCLLMGPVNVLMTHIKEVLVSNLKELLGLQETKHLLDRLHETHPIVVEDFINRKKSIRKIRKILQNLLSERVSIRDLVTIVETIGDYETELDKGDMVTEMVRQNLARQICWSYMDVEGKISALSLSKKFEDHIKTLMKKQDCLPNIANGEGNGLISHIRRVLEDYKNPRVIFCEPCSRPFFRRFTENHFPHLGILSTAEVVRGIKMEILGELGLPEEDLPVRIKKEEPAPIPVASAPPQFTPFIPSVPPPEEPVAPPKPSTPHKDVPTPLLSDEKGTTPEEPAEETTASKEDKPHKEQKGGFLGFFKK